MNAPGAPVYTVEDPSRLVSGDREQVYRVDAPVVAAILQNIQDSLFAPIGRHGGSGSSRLDDIACFMLDSVVMRRAKPKSPSFHPTIVTLGPWGDGLFSGTRKIPSKARQKNANAGTFHASVKLFAASWSYFKRVAI